MNRIVLSRCGDFSLITDGKGNYYIYELKDTVVGASGTIQELRSELIRWMVEVDSNNGYMLEVEQKFIYALDMCEKFFNKTMNKKQLTKEFNSMGLNMTDKNYMGKYELKRDNNLIHEFRNLKEGVFSLLYMKTGILSK